METYNDWYTRVMREWNTTNLYKSVRLGQFLYNNLPNRLYGKIPHSFDPYYNDENVGIFLTYLIANW